jgi:DNA-directed RNA polymerase subunit beta'
LDVLLAFKDSDNKPEWLVLEVLPVLPPDLRPMLPLEGGRYGLNDINILYKHIINRNRGLANSDSITPRMIIRSEKILLQEAVNNLMDSEWFPRKHRSSKTDTPLKSFTNRLTGKKGRFRLNLLGKRVDYSGRSVIIVGPELEMHQCGIPREMAYVLFKPFILRQLKIDIYNSADPSLEKGTQMERKLANLNAVYEQKSEICLSILEKVVKEHPVLLNRAPTLHRLGIQAFEPILIDGKAIRLNPLVCAGFNADFEGDQMGVHLVLTPQAQAEARILMLASNNILNPKDGKPIVSPTQDIILGNYYLTIEKNVDSEKETFLDGSFYNGFNEVILALENGLIDLHTRIFVDPKQIKSTFTDFQKTKKLITTPGKLIFNNILPESFPYLSEPSEINLDIQTPDKFFFSAVESPKSFIKNLPISKPFDKRFIELIISKLFSTIKISETSKTLDALKSLGFKYCTLSGISVALSDFILNPRKQEAIAEARIKVDEVVNNYNLGLLTKDFKRKSIETIWDNVTNEMKDELNRYLPKDNNLFMIKDSGARGDDKQLVQLESMIGLILGPKGKTIEFPVLSSYMEGLSVEEYFICTHGARKGSTDIALKTSSSGYFTRRLVDAVHDIVIRDDDCQTDKYIEMEALAREETERKDGDNTEISYLITLEERIFGRYTAKAVINPTNKEVIVKKNEMITEKIAKEIVKAGVTKVAVRSVLKCNSEHGVCAKCYGLSLSSNTPSDIGEPVGVIAAQSIGEPGTQLTMRTFHTGGVAGGGDITTGLPRVQELLDCRSSLKSKALLSPVDGTISGINYSKGIITIEQKNTGKKYECVYDLKVKPTKERGIVVKIGDRLTPGPIDPRELMKYKSVDEAQRYIIGEVLKVYYSASAKINDKHLEIILKQMFNWVYVTGSGDSNILPNSEVSRAKFLKACKECALEGKEFPTARVIIMGVTKVASNSDSFLSAASFQNTRKQLANAAIRGSKDELHGLKENAMIGGIIPAGTGLIDEKFEFSSDSTVD